ncbi:secreted RxLR effector protein 161-like [Gastrolobium bilobum]|uniref:secreted RxLR effector protein 161-like n=1 Tax=Gastrolobium bilobum TaxID=150636 RepID=UPI002AB2F728|nr:secreted RxLR effector protein 161-like [Gastrolobium bilobum]
MKNIPYASAVGSLTYAQVCTRPDIAFAVGVLGRYQSNSGLDHWKVAKKVIRYLQGTKDYMLMFRRTDNLEVIGYSNSDYAGCIDSRKSTSGYIFKLASGDVSWRSVKHTLTATSTMEADGSRSKHIDIKYLAIREHVKDKAVVIERISTELSQYIFNGLKIESITLRPEMKLLIHTSCEVALKQETNSAFIVKVAVKVYLTLL